MQRKFKHFISLQLACSDERHLKARISALRIAARVDINYGRFGSTARDRVALGAALV